MGASIEEFDEEVTIFSDSDWAGCKDTRNSSCSTVTPWKHTHASNRSLQEAAQKQSCILQHWERLSQKELCRC